MATENTKNTQTWVSFAEQSSMHGIRFVFMKEIPLPRRITWSAAVLICLAYSVYATALFLNGYFSKVVSTMVRIQDAPSLQFPAVTICNRNYWKYSSIQTLTQGNSIGARHLEDIAHDLYMNQPLPPPPGKYNWSDPDLAYLLNDDFRTKLWTLLDFMPHSFNETFISCQENGKTAVCNDMFVTVKTALGVCFRFNHDGQYISHSAGMSGGIMMVMDVQADEYYLGPNSQSEGFGVTIHSSDEVPLVEELAYAVSPGTEANFLLEMTKIDRVPPPADGGKSDCVDTEKIPNSLFFHKTYSQTACADECKVSYVIEKCGCRELLQIELNETSHCNFKEMLTCSTPALRQFPLEHEYLERCNCKAACKEIHYSAKLSTSKYPSAAFSRNNIVNETELEYMRNNHVVIKIAYGKLTYQHLEERIMYTIHDFIANLGGIFGVCIGGSILTFIELLEYIVVKLTYLLCMRANNRKKTTPIKAFVDN